MIGSKSSSTGGGRFTALIAMHSFTPVFKGVVRPWPVGVLYDRDPRFAHLLMALLKREEGLVVVVMIFIELK
jgi:predicted N-formylglutamate amidohydrolase